MSSTNRYKSKFWFFNYSALYDCIFFDTALDLDISDYDIESKE